MKGFKSEKQNKRTVSKKISLNELFLLATNKHKNGELKEASKYYQKSIELGIKSQSLLCNYGVLCKQLGENEKAIKLYEMTIKLYPNHPDAYYNYGNLLFHTNNIIKAEVLINKAIDLKSNFTQAYYVLSKILKSNNELIKAKNSLLKVIDLDPTFIEAILQLNELLLNLNQKIEAKNLLLNAIKVSKHSAELHINLGAILIELGELIEAELITRTAIDLNPNLAIPYKNLSVILRDSGNLNEAEVSIRKAIQIDPNYVKAIILLGTILLEKNNSDEAKKCWLKAIDLSPNSESAIFKLSKRLYHEQNYELAIHYLEKSNNEEAKVLLLGCILSLDKKSDFYIKYHQISSAKICNAEIGGIVEHANIIYKDKLDTLFCNKAIDYIMFDRINKECFSDDYFNQLIEYFKDSKNNKRYQAILKSGTQTSGNLFSLEYPFIKALKKSLEKKIFNYQQKYQNSTEGFIKNWPKNYELRSWMIGMKKGGFLQQHNHGYGWITGSFYLEIPELNDSHPDSGNIAFSYQGPYYPSKEKDFSLTKRVVKVRDICIFPSSLFHHTIPFQSTKERICFVFDLTPSKDL